MSADPIRFIHRSGLVAWLGLAVGAGGTGAAAAADSLPPATSPAEALAALHPKPGHTVDLVAAEPLVIDPIAIDWGTDGRLWVVEMRDYPMGLDGRWKPGGVIKVLADTDGDGAYDEATVFLEDIPFPTGVMPWRQGALICAAPDILYAEDTDGDGRADVMRTVLTGFPTDNYQARVNGLALGLDNWVYGANTMRDGTIKGLDRDGQPVEVRSHDFRFQPDTGVVEAAAGRTQFGRARDDWDNWFGCHNSNPVLHFPLPDHYVRRNPHVALAPGTVFLPDDREQNRLYPLAEPVRRFNHPDQLNYLTAGCGLGIQRDILLGEEYYGNAFVCDSVHGLVTRLQLTARGATFAARRAGDEMSSEFLASTSIWFTPVQSRPGPDGALWVVDMVRPINEHPSWIPPDRLATLDVRAGDEQGRIFRVRPTGERLRPIRDLTSLDLPDLVAAMDQPNGTARDLVHLELLFRGDTAAVPGLEAVFQSSPWPAARLQALAAIDALGRIGVAHVQQALRDPHPGVRRFALRLGERFLRAPSPLDEYLGALAQDPDAGVRYQLALALGEWHDAAAGAGLLARLVSLEEPDRWLMAAVITAATKDPAGLLNRVLADGSDHVARGRLAADLVITAVALAGDIDSILLAAAPPAGQPAAGWRFAVLAGLQDALERRGLDLAACAADGRPEVAAALQRIRSAYTAAAGVVEDERVAPEERQAALRLVGRGFNDFESGLPLLVSLLDDASGSALVPVAVETIRRSGSPRVPDMLLGRWNQFTPSLRATVAEILDSLDAWLVRLLDAIEAGTIAAATIPVSQRQRLLQRDSPPLQARAEKLFAAGSSPDRREVIAAYRTVHAMTGDVRRGAEVFEQACAACHDFAGQRVGPRLADFRNKGVDDLLEALFDPNAAVEPRFAGYLVTMKDGRSLAGVISAESAASFNLVLADGSAQPVLRAEVASIAALDRSLMPEGLEDALSPRDVADLVAYLAASHQAAGSAPETLREELP